MGNHQSLLFAGHLRRSCQPREEQAREIIDGDYLRQQKEQEEYGVTAARALKLLAYHELTCAMLELFHLGFRASLFARSIFVLLFRRHITFVALFSDACDSCVMEQMFSGFPTCAVHLPNLEIHTNFGQWREQPDAFSGEGFWGRQKPHSTLVAF